MGVIHTREVTVTPSTDQYSWSVIDNATNSAPNWIATPVQQGTSDLWDFDVEVNTGTARSATATVTHSDGNTTASFEITQAGAPPSSPTLGSYDAITSSTSSPDDEGDTITFTVSTSNIGVGAVPTYELTQYSGSFNASDIVGGALTGNMSAIDANGQSTVSIQLANDNTQEGIEEYRFKVTGDDAGTASSEFPVLSTVRQINDTSAPAPAWTSLEVQTMAGTTITNNYQGGNEGWSLTAVLTGANRPAGETLYWRLDYSSASYEAEAGQDPAQSNDFNADSGSFQTGQTSSLYNQSGSDNIGWFSYTAVLDYVDEGNPVFGVPSGSTLSGYEGYGIRIYTDSNLTNEITDASGNPLRVVNFSLHDVTTQATTGALIEGPSMGESPGTTSSTSTSTTTSPSTGCHVAGTMIEMADGTFKAIENIVAGDQVITAKIDGLSIIEDAWLTWVSAIEYFSMEEVVGHVSKMTVGIHNIWVNVNSGLIKVTEEHPLLSNRSGVVAYREIKDLGIGDKIYLKSGAGSYAWVDITSYELELSNPEKTPVNVYSLNVENEDSYFANGVLAHNILTGNNPGTVGKQLEM